MMRSGAIKGAGPFFSGREPDVPAIQSYPHAEANLPTRYPTHRKQRGGRIVAERRKTFGEAINGALLYGSEHFGVPITLANIG